jgi:cold shock protein
LANTFSMRDKEIVMITGTVKFFDSTKGFGFIKPDNGGTDVFVHISAVERSGLRTIVEGQKLSFEIVKNERSGKSAAENLQAV